MRDDITVSDMDDDNGPRVTPEPSSRYSHSLELACAALECFTADRTTMGVYEIAELIDTSRPTAFRYAKTLVALGSLQQDNKRRYLLASGAASPGAKIIDTIKHELKARAILEGLRNQTGHTVTLGVLHDTRIVLVERLCGHRAGQYEVDHDLRAGANVPLHCTALGKALFVSLANNERDRLLERIKFTSHGPNTITTKERFIKEIEKIDPLGGSAVSDEELFSGSRSIAALVPRTLRYGYSAAIDVTVPSTAFTVAQLVGQIGPLIEAAADSIVN